MGSPWEDIPGFRDVELIDNGVVGSISRAQATARLRYIVEWDKAWDAARAFLGGQEVVVDPNTGASIVINRPRQHPHNPALFAVNATIVDPLGAGRLPANEEEEVEYDYARIEVDYESAVWTDDAPRRIISAQAGSEVIQFGEYAWQFSPGGQRFPAPLSVSIPVIDYRVMIPNATRIPPAVWIKIGNVSNAPFEGQPAGLHRFAAFNATETIAGDGSILYSLEYGMRYRRVHWNWEFNPFVGDFQLVTHPSTGKKKFDEADLSDIYI